VSRCPIYSRVGLSAYCQAKGLLFRVLPRRQPQYKLLPSIGAAGHFLHELLRVGLAKGQPVEPSFLAQLLIARLSLGVRQHGAEAIDPLVWAGPPRAASRGIVLECEFGMSGEYGPGTGRLLLPPLRPRDGTAPRARREPTVHRTAGCVLLSAQGQPGWCISPSGRPAGTRHENPAPPGLAMSS
jgi:hypothetical protein